ncbi:MAG TPA: M15 family metallopeptidase [Myxococcales bacterium]|jgi:D-alanyl-D-alanine dipeptidase|nr:M15 family metallopeptidase [Myxococcales bacterium]
MLLALLIAAQTWGPQRLPPVLDAEDPLVDASGIVTDLIVDLAYATSENITGRALYPADAKCLLRRSVAERLAVAADALRKRGLRLIARDCTRPPDAQAALWKAHPHAGAVADPSRGSLHARGVAIDLDLADLAGARVEVPTKLDAFGPEAAADAPLLDGAAKEHREALKTAMHAAGFRVNPKEWWHYSRLYGWRWPVATSR